MVFVALLPVLLLAGTVGATPMTFQDTDPITGRPLECDRCPPGTFLQARCTSTRKSECAPCPSGSFTELWNYIGKCLRCGVCGRDQVMKTDCTPERDCQCECKQGYYYKKSYDMCVPHSKCATGQGVLTAGTANEDTVCHVCHNDTYSDIVSAHQNCTEHKSCDAAGLKMALKGSVWHDNVCTSCRDNRLRDGANYLKEILPGFFVHQKMSIRRLRRVVHKLPSEDGKKQEGTSRLNLAELHERIDAWVASATVKQIRQLPAILTKTGANSASERLQNKLHRIDSGLATLCDLENEVDVNLMSGLVKVENNFL